MSESQSNIEGNTMSESQPNTEVEISDEKSPSMEVTPSQGNTVDTITNNETSEIETQSDQSSDETEVKSQSPTECTDHSNNVETNESIPGDINNEHSNSRASRELKSILALSKEARLDTNISHKRRSIDLVKTKEQKESPSGKCNEALSGKKYTKLFATDIRPIKFPVTAEAELEANISDIMQGGEKDNGDSSLRKRKGSCTEVVAEGATQSIIIRQSFSDNNLTTKMRKDTFCWRCHRDGINISCETCPRSYHYKCLKQSIADTEHWPCPECVGILKAESTQTRSEAMKGMTLEHLCGLLKFALKRMIRCQDSQPFLDPVSEAEFPDYKRYIVQPMSLNLLDKNIKDNIYGSTQAFEADAKWLLHNSIIFNSYQSKLTTVAKSIIKVCKQEMAEIENCPSCYLNANTKKDTWFVEVCPKPHVLVWAKLKGFPHWPAKAMTTNSSGMVDVRFFGAHDRAWVPSKECFLYCRRDPNSHKQKKHDIIECVKELEIHIDNLRKVYGEFHYAPFKMPYDPSNETKQLQIFLPRYKADYKPKLGKHKLSFGLSDSSPSSPAVSPGPECNGKSSESNIHLGTEVKKESLDSTMEGYGTDDDSYTDSRSRRVPKCNQEESDVEENAEADVNAEQDEDSDTQIVNSVLTETTPIRGKVRTRGGMNTSMGKLKIIPRQLEQTTTAPIPKRPSTDSLFLDGPIKMPRRNSDQSVKSDSSRLSTLSEKINIVDISENMEISLGNNDEGCLSILDGGNSNTENLESKPSSIETEKDIEVKKKPVQVEIENNELSLSPQSKLKIASQLMKTISETPEYTSPEDILKTMKEKKEQNAEASADVGEQSQSAEKQLPVVKTTSSMDDKNPASTSTKITDINSTKEHITDPKSKVASDLQVSETLVGVSTENSSPEKLKEKSTVATENIVKVPNQSVSSTTTENTTKIPQDQADDISKNSSAPIERMEIDEHNEEDDKGDCSSSEEVGSAVSEISQNEKKSEVINEQVAVVEHDEDSDEVDTVKTLDDSQIDEANIINIIHSSLIVNPNVTKTKPVESETDPLSIEDTSSLSKKRKASEEKDVDSKSSEEANPSKVVKLVPGVKANDNSLSVPTKTVTPKEMSASFVKIPPLAVKLSTAVTKTSLPTYRVIIKSSASVVPPKDIVSTTNSTIIYSTVASRTSTTQGNTNHTITAQANTVKSTQPVTSNNIECVEIKSEPESDNDNDNEYMEAKRKYMSALNISERQDENATGKTPEIRTRSKTEEVRSKLVDNVAKTIEDVASRYNTGDLIDPLSRVEESLSNNVPEEQQIYVKPLAQMMQTPPKQRARKSFPKPNYASPPVSAAAKNPLIYPKPPTLTKADNTPGIKKTGITPQNQDKNKTITDNGSNPPPGLVLLTQPITLLPPNQTISYNPNGGINPVLSVVSQATAMSVLNPALQTKQPGQSTTKTVNFNYSQNYIPQNEIRPDSASTPTASSPPTTPTTMLGNLLVDLNAPSANQNSALPTAAATQDSNEEHESTLPATSDEFTLLNGILPDNVTKEISNLLCRPPPKLKPRPPGPLSTRFEESIPSSAGPVTTKINSVAHKLTDYFRGMLVELLEEFGKTDNTEATISLLKAEIETLKHKHTVELNEVKKNINTTLKDVQKCIIESRERTIEETKTICEAETIKRVEEAKSKQWCANCTKEAQFYCCWNTSYCDYPCQQKHWAKHMSKCTQNSGHSSSSGIRPSGQVSQFVIRPSTASGKDGKKLVSKPTKVYVNRNITTKNITTYKRPAGQITLVEGNELQGISLSGKLLNATSLVGKIKTVMTSATSSPSSTTGVNTQYPRMTSVLQTKSPASAVSSRNITISDDSD